MKWGAVSRTTALHRGGVHGSVCAHSRSTRSRSFQLSHPNAELDAAHADPHCLLLHHAKCLQVPLLGPCTGHHVQRIHQRLPFPADLIFPRPQFGEVIGHLTTPVMFPFCSIHASACRVQSQRTAWRKPLNLTSCPLCRRHAKRTLGSAISRERTWRSLQTAVAANTAECSPCPIGGRPVIGAGCPPWSTRRVFALGGDQRLTSLMRCRRFS